MSEQINENQLQSLLYFERLARLFRNSDTTTEENSALILHSLKTELKRALEEKTLSEEDVKTAEKIISAQHRPKPRYHQKKNACVQQPPLGPPKSS
jgi:hypothetical protein